MHHPRPWLAAFAGILLSWMMAASAAAQAPGAGTVEAAPETRDAQLVQQAYGALERSGYAGLAPYLPRLREALERAPAQYPAVVIRGHDIDVWATDGEDMVALSEAAASAVHASDAAAQVNVRPHPNVYPEVAMLLTSDAVERRRFKDALAYADRGLAMQPDFTPLVVERTSALGGLGRHDQVLEAVDAALAGSSPILRRYRGALLRKRGFSLVELRRLDEGQAAYEESLKADPGHPVAVRELQYIAKLKAGGRPTGTELLAPVSRPPGPNPAS